MILEKLEPNKVFYYFEKLCSVPHGSGNTKQISDMLVGFAKELGLKYRQDELNNVIVWKDGTHGLEKAAPVILQGHMDMVCVSDPAKAPDKDMTKDGLDLVVEGDWLRAEGTSLGGDDGIAVAIAFAILSDDSLKHPPLEVIITVDEEVGMDGAFGIDLSDVKARRMLNIDSEEEGVFTVSCAGGVRADSFIPAKTEALCSEDILYRVSIDGLLGGHSGCEIEKGRGNAVKLIARALYAAVSEIESLKLCSISGGRFDNVICPACGAAVAINRKDSGTFEKLMSEYADAFEAEYSTADPGVSLTSAVAGASEDCSCSGAFSHSDSLNILRALFSLPQGVIEMSQDIKGLPQTSLNLGVITSDSNGVQFSHSIRSSITSQKMYVLDRVKAVVCAAGGTVSTRGMYPGWAYNRDSAFRAKLAEVYKEQTGNEAVITATHGGLECGLLIEKLPGLDCVSIGPDLRDIHSAAEKMNIPSVGRLYDLITGFLKEL